MHTYFRDLRDENNVSKDLKRKPDKKKPKQQIDIPHTELSDT